MKKLTLTLGERPIEVGFPFGVASVWRQRLKEPLNEVLGQISALQGLEIEKVEDIVPALHAAAPFIIDLPDKVAYLLYEIPDLKAVEDRLKMEAGDDEHFQAFEVVLKAAFPFGGLIQMIRQVQQVPQPKNGSEPTPTSTNSPLPSGELKQ